ncbi:lamin tail domain-containing protein [Chitinophaga sp. sic0106]|uniref:lamin tail domain-containing protein n=1 Tax=Chitinophaga sp. sic0106 TaxID=2854785 RepID=UPI001C47E09D|nr:lamin tail domain-containing protein [Chitinophaga sp. sic0106]MBV7528500.1 lamin tail domain-containing protein [Chitinophaga sp. sic0106]
MFLTLVCHALVMHAVLLISADTSSPKIHEVVIHEIMAKPTPAKGLPPIEYLEVLNRTNEVINLQGCILKVNNREISLPAVTLPPQGLGLLCPQAGVDSFLHANTIVVSRWPAIADDTGTIVLYSPQREVIHAVSYNRSWYGHPAKDDGGYSLEMVNDAIPCAGKSNWRASTADAGGTPGNLNAAAADWDEQLRPDLLYSSIPDSNHTRLVFALPLDSNSAATTTNYELTETSTGRLLRPSSVTVIPPFFTSILISWEMPMRPEEKYHLHTKNLISCTGMESLQNTALPLAIPAPAGRQQVLFSEILFDPAKDISGFIEIVNTGGHAVDLQQLVFKNIRGDATADPGKRLSNDHRILLPGQCLAFTSNAMALCHRYGCTKPRGIQEINMPATYVAGGQLLLTADTMIQDLVSYNADWHFRLLNDGEGISLARISFERPAATAENWTSTPSNDGFATPGWIKEVPAGSSEALNFSILTPFFTPESASGSQVAKCSLDLGKQQWMGTVSVYDITGRPIRTLARNTLLSGSASWTWDGCDEKKVLLPAGVYIFLIEIFNLKGQTRRWKEPVVMARNFH